MSVSILDYGAGNLLSVARSFETQNCDIHFISTPEEILKSERLILPGVGAFKDGMTHLNALRLVEPIREFAASGKPFLGICLGMQMLLDRSYEFGIHEGLGLVEGEVLQIPLHNHNQQKHKIPHIGWNELQAPRGNASWQSTILEHIPVESTMYFVHSFMAIPQKSEHNLAITDYNGISISAVIRKDNIYGCQFHPEKSGENGLTIIKTFLEL